MPIGRTGPDREHGNYYHDYCKVVNSVVIIIIIHIAGTTESHSDGPQNAPKYALWDPNIKKFSGEGALHPHSAPAAPQFVRLRRSTCPPQTEILDPPLSRDDDKVMSEGKSLFLLNTSDWSKERDNVGDLLTVRLCTVQCWTDCYNLHDEKNFASLNPEKKLEFSALFPMVNHALFLVTCHFQIFIRLNIRLRE